MGVSVYWKSLAVEEGKVCLFRSGTIFVSWRINHQLASSLLYIDSETSSSQHVFIEQGDMVHMDHTCQRRC